MAGADARALAASAGADLRPLLETAGAVAQSARVSTPPPPMRLAANAASVRAAAVRARITPVAPHEAARPWWQRPISFASVSVPAGALVAMAVLGVAGAAAAGYAISTTDIPGAVRDIGGFQPESEAPAPAAGAPAPGVAPSGDGTSPEPPAAAGKTPDAASPQAGAPPAATTEPEPTPAAGGQVPPLPGEDGEETTSTPAPTASPADTVAAEGVITDINGNTFTLQSPDGEFKVNLDSKTVVSGAIVEGATARVAGRLTGERNLHADEVTVTSGAPSSTPAGPGGGNGNGGANGNGGGSGNGNGGGNGNGNGPPN
jgi:hypothetical protein